MFLGVMKPIGIYKCPASAQGGNRPHAACVSLSLTCNMTDKNIHCTLYTHHAIHNRYLLVRQGGVFPIHHVLQDWRLVAHGFEPPDNAKHYVSVLGSHEMEMR